MGGCDVSAVGPPCWLRFLQLGDEQHRPAQGIGYKFLQYHDRFLPQETLRCVSESLFRCCLCVFSPTAPVFWRRLRTFLSAPGKGSFSRMTKVLISNFPNR